MKKKNDTNTERERIANDDLLDFDEMAPDDLIPLKVRDDPEEWEQIPKWQFELTVTLLRFGIAADKIKEMVEMQENICSGEEKAIRHMLDTVEFVKTCLAEMEKFCEPNA